ncbi:tetratricopeptide repeat protein [Macrococcoides bohemicum]|uniref:tetratricopeptide repeat protein n=1 Tax=Macrococcoides bohemicum TaxID=1903056 RepID=UPI001C5CFA90|nr:tetratricopeptide repeat protein [Macrococcus bohemicus]QYA44826.1 tetratricopeptide repeat protein [Macrococcus bohemicus]
MENFEKLNEAIVLREKGRAEDNQKLITQSRTMLFELLELNKNNPDVNYHVGVSFDNAGFTLDAIPYYEKSIELGLNTIDLERCYLGLGSSYRLVGEYEKAVKVLKTGVKLYPTNKALQTFLSIAYYNVGNYKEALEITLNNLVDTSDDEKIKFFNKPLKFYANHLDETWSPKKYKDN